MSFISKLFRKTETTDSAPGSQNEAEAPPTAASESEQASSAALDATPAESPPDEAAALSETSIPAETETTAPPAESPSASDWWNETETPEETPEPARAVAGTQPLAEDSVPVQEPPPPSDLQHAEQAPEDESAFEQDEEEGGTRQLTAADKPALAMLRSHRGLAAGALRDIGRVRSINQDSIFSLITTLPREGGDVMMGLFVVADGMGGHHGGEVASRIAISTVAHYVLAELVVPALADGATEALQPLIIAAVQEANRAIWEHAQTVGSDMGTTCTVALLLGRALYLGHVGDSRAYLATPTGLKLITNDHSTVGRLIQVGQLDPSEAREHPLRSQLYRTVGQQSEVMVDFTYQQIGDATHLLMGSDGLWGMLGDEVMFDVLEHASWPQDACAELIARANMAGGEDNISAIVVSLPSQL